MGRLNANVFPMQTAWSKKKECSQANSSGQNEVKWKREREKKKHKNKKTSQTAHNLSYSGISSLTQDICIALVVQGEASLSTRADQNLCSCTWFK